MTTDDPGERAAIQAVRAELGWQEREGGFECRLTGSSGAFALLVPFALLGLAVLTAGLASLWVGLALTVIAILTMPRQGGRVHGLRVQSGALEILGPDAKVPLQTIQRVDLTVPGLTLHVEGGEPVTLQLTQSLGSRAWLAEQIRQAVLRHGDFDDVPATLARLRGESEHA